MTCARGVAVMVTASLFILLLAGTTALAATLPCRNRTPVMAEFPPKTAQTPALTPATVRQLAGGKGWGFENLTIEPAPLSDTGIVMAVRIPKGSIDPGHKGAPVGGIGFRWRADIPSTATAACLSYRLLLPADFVFAKGGKLPGLFGGDGPAGGKPVDGRTGFSARFMWRANGAGEVYAYIPTKPDGRGESIARGAWTFPRGRWSAVEQEIELNAPGIADGVLRVWLDGTLVLDRTDMLYRTTSSLGFAGVMADVFYGGKTAEWAAPADTVVRLSPFQLGWR